MIKILFASGKILHSQDRLWRLLFEFSIASFLAFLLITTSKYTFGKNETSSPSVQVSSSYKSTVPLGTVSALATVNVDQPKQTSTILATPQDIESDERLQQLHISVQGIDYTLNKSERCEKLAVLLSPITPYDRKRAKAVHNNILSEGDICTNRMLASDIRLTVWKAKATAVQQNANASNSIALVNAVDALTKFDRERRTYTQYKHFNNLGDDAKEDKKQSDASLFALQESVNTYSENPNPNTENVLIQQVSELSSFDLERPEPHNLSVVAMAQDITKQAHQRSSDLRELKELQNIFSATHQISVKNTERVAELVTRFENVADTLLTPQQRTDIVELIELSAEYQIKQLGIYAEQYKHEKSNTTLQNLEQQLIFIETDYRPWLQNIAPRTLASAREARQLLHQSDARLHALITTAKNVEQKMTKTNIQALSNAKQTLTSFDLSRLSPTHAQALQVATNAQSGVLESNQRMEDFTQEYNTYVSTGCTSTTLRRLREARFKVNEFDLDRGSNEFLNTINKSKGYLRRNYCIDSAIKIKPI